MKFRVLVALAPADLQAILTGCVSAQPIRTFEVGTPLALLDAHIRKVSSDQALGSRGFDNYSWHTDLPPGHPMVTGQQTVEFDLSAVEHARTVVVWGMNWICTKMPDAHWLTEARLKGTRVVVIACEYSATATKADDVVVVRPGTTPALALGFANVIMRDRLYDADYVKRWTDLPLLVRTDTLKMLRAAEVFGGGDDAVQATTTTDVNGAVCPSWTSSTWDEALRTQALASVPTPEPETPRTPSTRGRRTPAPAPTAAPPTP